MKCKYTFKVKGYLKLNVKRSIHIRGKTYEFITNNEDVVVGLAVLVPANQPGDLPRLVASPNKKIKASIHISSPGFEDVKREVRTIEGLLSIFGVSSIDANAPATEWLPESEDEKAQLDVFNFKIDTVPLDISKVPPLPFDLAARSIIAADKATSIEVQLSFYRKGLSDFEEERYIEAIYDFYFFMESSFSSGKTKNHRVKESFKNSDFLKECIKEVFENPIEKVGVPPKDLQLFMKCFSQKSVDELIEHMVELRGFLHHHTPSRKDAWHPEDHKRFHLDAMLFRAIASCAAMKQALEFLFEPSVFKDYVERFGTLHSKAALERAQQ